MADGPHVPVQATTDEVHAHAHHTGHRWVDMTIALSAIAISIISLFVAVQHGRTEEKLVAANSWPFLVYSSEYDDVGSGDGKVLLQIQNAGVGPARLQSLAVALDGRPVASRADLLARCCGITATDTDALVKRGLFARNPAIGVLPARSSTTVLGWRERPGNAATVAAFDRMRKRLTFSACYCSVLDECWVTDLKSTSTPRPVSDCGRTGSTID